jgi:hypothetical protein
MPAWKLTCPKCQYLITLKAEEILVECGLVPNMWERS